MKLKDYQPLARRTMKELSPVQKHLEHMALGVIGEIGEFADGLKKHDIYGKGVGPDGLAKAVSDGGVLDKVNLMEEGGDAFWYIVGFLPELNVDIDVLEGAFKHGELLGKDLLAAGVSATEVVAQANAQIGTAAYSLLTIGTSSRAMAFANVQILGKNMGMLYGYFDLDLAQSLDRNIAKLAKRYGDKYSDLAALSRDLDGERKVLESAPPAAQPRSDLTGEQLRGAYGAPLGGAVSPDAPTAAVAGMGSPATTGPAAGFTGTAVAGLNTKK